MAGISWLAEWVLAPQEGLCSMGLVNTGHYHFVPHPFRVIVHIRRAIWRDDPSLNELRFIFTREFDMGKGIWTSGMACFCVLSFFMKKQPCFFFLRLISKFNLDFYWLWRGSELKKKNNLKSLCRFAWNVCCLAIKVVEFTLMELLPLKFCSNVSL
jgi:hypothetical protein